MKKLFNIGDNLEIRKPSIYSGLSYIKDITYNNNRYLYTVKGYKYIQGFHEEKILNFFYSKSELRKQKIIKLNEL